MKKLFFVFLAGATISKAQQQNFEKAYIISDKGDTIKGEARINPKKPAEAHERIYFKDANGVQKNHKPEKIRGYGVQDKNYITLDFDGEPRFYQVLTSGDINLYMLAFESMRMNAVTYDVEYFIAKPDNKRLVSVKQGRFKKQLTEWMKDNPEFLTDYEDGKEFDEEKAVAVISKYNSWKAGKENQ